MSKFVFIKSFKDITLMGRQLNFLECQEAINDFKKRLKRAGQRGEFKTPVPTRKRSMSRCMVIRQDNVAFKMTDAEFTENQMKISGMLCGPKRNLFKVNSDTQTLESILNSKPVELKMRALVRPKESDPETASLIKILTFDLCAPEE